MQVVEYIVIYYGLAMVYTYDVIAHSSMFHPMTVDYHDSNDTP